MYCLRGAAKASTYVELVESYSITTTMNGNLFKNRMNGLRDVDKFKPHIVISSSSLLHVHVGN